LLNDFVMVFLLVDYRDSACSFYPQFPSRKSRREKLTGNEALSAYAAGAIGAVAHIWENILRRRRDYRVKRKPAVIDHADWAGDVPDEDAAGSFPL
jgi:hypothetical protein